MTMKVMKIQRDGLEIFMYSLVVSVENIVMLLLEASVIFYLRTNLVMRGASEGEVPVSGDGRLDSVDQA